MVLKLSVYVMYMYLNVSTFGDLHYQTCWDDLLPMHEEIVDIAEVILNARYSEEKESWAKPVFQMDHCIIGPLFTVVFRCRDPYLRRRAVALLYKVPRQEGVWNSHLTARCAERMINIEEEGLG